MSRRDAALALVTRLQRRHADRLQAAAASMGAPTPFEAVSWERDGGAHGGGTRLQAAPGGAYQRASVNISQVHYDDRPDKPLASATALSAIVHPDHPRAPSMHLHASFTALKSGRAYWRIMADLNPALPDPAQAAAFRAALQEALGAHAAEAFAQGDRYFAIPDLGRRRGVVHAYLEGFDSGDFASDLALAERVEAAAIDAYGALVEQSASGPVTAPDRDAQRAYHTVYLFQVLTLDRGTTAGLMVHGDNDVGILGSLPATVDRALLASWADRVPGVKRALVEGLVDALPDAHPCEVDVPTKRRLAAAVRAFYAAHPDALSLQARGDTLPPTVANHTGRVS